MTGLTLPDTHESFDIFFHEFGSVGVVVAAFEIRDDALVSRFVDGSGGEFSAARDGYLVFFVSGSVKNHLEMFGL